METYLDQVDPLEEHLSLTAVGSQILRATKDQEYVGHLASFSEPVDAKHWGLMAAVMNSSGIEWGRVYDSSSNLIAFPSQDPYGVVRAVVAMLEAHPEPRPGFVMTAGIFVLEVKVTGVAVTGAIVERLKVLRRIVRPGQFLVAIPEDRGYSIAKNVEYRSRLKDLSGDQGRAEEWGLTKLPDGRQYDIFCVVSRALTVRWPMTDLRAR
jgi:hypothetical protein